MKPETAAACEFALSAIERAKDLLDQEVQTAITQDPPELIRYYADLCDAAEALRAPMAAIGKLENALSYQHIPASFDAAGIQNVRVTGYGLVSLNHRWSCSMLNKEQGLAYLRGAGQGGMIIETVPAPTLGAWARSETEEKGKEPPDDIFHTTVNRYVSLRASK